MIQHLAGREAIEKLVENGETFYALKYQDFKQHPSFPGKFIANKPQFKLFVSNQDVIDTIELELYLPVEKYSSANNFNIGGLVEQIIYFSDKLHEHLKIDTRRPSQIPEIDLFCGQYTRIYEFSNREKKKFMRSLNKIPDIVSTYD